eukprot:7867571-Pyramimonas_sp.AAC.1
MGHRVSSILTAEFTGSRTGARDMHSGHCRPRSTHDFNRRPPHPPPFISEDALQRLPSLRQHS